MTLFPITDPSRADDIRTRRKRAALLLGGIVCVPWLLWGGHRERSADSHQHIRLDFTIPPIPPIPPIPAVPPVPPVPVAGEEQAQRISANALTINLPCASTLTVEPDPTLSGQAILSVPRGGQRALDEISISGGVITGRGSCPDDSAVTIRTSNVMPIVLTQSGDNEVRIGRFNSDITINSSGSGTVSLDGANSVVVAMRHSGDVELRSVAGPLVADLEGSGDLHVRSGTIPALTARSQSSGSLDLGGARVLSGTVKLQGSGDLTLGSASGSFTAETRGSGSISISRADLAFLSLAAFGSGDLSIGGGHVERLAAVRYGSGDLSINARVDTGTLDHDGSGDVDIPDSGTLQRTRN